MGMIRDSQAINILFTELLPYCITPHDRVYIGNQRTLMDFFKKIKAEKEEKIKQGKVGVDLFSILLNEGADVY